MTLIPCPCCKGSGKRYDTKLGCYVNEPCTACHGSMVLNIDPGYWATVNAKPRGDNWTDNEKAMLVELTESGHTAKDCATIIGRSRHACSSKISWLKSRGSWSRLTPSKD